MMDDDGRGRECTIMFVIVNESATIAKEEVGLAPTPCSLRATELTRPMNFSSPRLVTHHPEVDHLVLFVVGAPLGANVSEGGGMAILADLVLCRGKNWPVRLGWHDDLFHGLWFVA